MYVATKLDKPNPKNIAVNIKNALYEKYNSSRFFSTIPLIVKAASTNSEITEDIII